MKMSSNPSRLYEFGLISLLFFTWGFVFLDRTALSFLVPVMVHDLNLSNSQIGQINMWQTIGYAIAGPLVAILSDKTGNRKKYLLIAVFSTSLFAALSAMANSYTSLLVLRTLVGASEGPILPLAMAMVAAASSPGHFGRNAGIVNCGVGVIAGTLGPVLVTQLASYTDWRMAFLLVSVPSFLLTFALGKFAKEVPKMALETEKQKEPILGSCLKALKYRNITISVFISIFFMAGYWLLFAFGPLYLTTAGKLSVEKMGFAMSAMGLVAILWTILVPLLSDYLGRKPILITSSLLCVLSPLTMYLFPQWLGTLVILAMFGGVIGAIAPIFMNIIPVETVPVNLSATSSALIIGAGEVVGSFVLGIGGALADSYGLPIIMILAAAAPLLMSLLGLALIETKPRKAKLAISDVVESVQ